MNWLLFVVLAIVWAAILAGGWLGWQLLRQNGRLLLRIEELERRLDEWEFGADDELVDESQGRARYSVRAEAEHENNGAQGTDAPYPDKLAGRFNNHSLARSKIKRDGLKAGTPAPDFTLPRLDGKGGLSLSELRGKRVLLVFSSPGCGPCNLLSPELEKFHRAQTQREVGRATPCAPPGDISQNGAQGTARPTSGINVVMISKGDPKENRAKVKEHGLTFPVVLQQQWEISRRYAMFATPIAYLIDEAGVITRDVAVGSDMIQSLMAQTTR